MHHPSRPPNRPDGSSALTAPQQSGGDPAAGAAAQTSRSNGGGERSFVRAGPAGGGDPESPSWRRTNSSPDGLGVFHTRSIFHLHRRASSGYFSADGDSLPSSPLSPRPATADGATQTPSPAGQLMKHALQRMSEAREPGTPQQHGRTSSSSSTRQRNAAEEMQTEAIGRELRRFGDDYNRQLLLRGMAGGHVIHPNPLPHIHQEPAVLLCVGLLLLLVIYLQSSTNSQDRSQV
ncbi:hypothetical protein VZT92_001209 [Zoarces viviparus]|uniref:Bcl-2-like protein 11 n=1 Tax=Zoarces viviparus TaxID=48416 RepID=A0AAW1G1J0_ZOAVI